jgi:hypothetical protein
MPRRKRVVHRRKKRVARRGRMRGRGFFGDLWSGIKRAVTRPSTWLTGASMLPTPLAPLFKVGSVISGLTGHGRKRRCKRGRGLMYKRPVGAIYRPFYGVKKSSRMIGSGLITEPL